MVSKKLVHKLRFKEFDDIWEEHFLNKFFENRNERNFEKLEVWSITINEGVLKRSELGSDRKNKDKKSKEDNIMISSTGPLDMINMIPQIY